MSFSAEWLALRAEADARARSAELIAMAGAHIDTAPRPLRITDLGSGTGATVRAVSHRLPQPQEWTLVDADEALLAAASRELGGDVTVRVADLAASPAPWDAPPALVTASALFDLVSAAWIDRFAEALGEARAPLLSMLTFDGRLSLEPSLPGDDEMCRAFHTHQRRDKGFGPAAGPEAAKALAQALSARGYAVALRSTPWVLEKDRDAELMAALFDGWAEAAAEEGVAAAADWRAARTGRTDRLLVGHVDMFAAPGD